MLISARFIRRRRQARILAPDGVPVTRDVICGTVIYDPWDYGLQVFVRLVEACNVVGERSRVRDRDVGDVWAVVGSNGGPDIEEDAIVVEDSWRASHAPIACSQGFCEAVAAGCWMRTDPVACRRLVCLDYDGVTLT